MEIASALYGFSTVPIYDNNAGGSMKFILEETKCRTIFCEKEGIEDIKKNATEYIENIVSFDDIPTENEEEKIKLLTLN